LNEDLAKLKSNLETMRLIYHSKNKQDLTYMAIKRFFALLKLQLRRKVSPGLCVSLRPKPRTSRLSDQKLCIENLCH